VTVPTLFVTGPVGVGKTSVAAEMLDVLEERGVPCAFFDLDALTAFHPRPAGDRFGEHFALEALSSLYAKHRDRGIERLILARVLENRHQLDGYREAVAGAEITVVRLTAPLVVIHARLRGRERGAGLDWHLERAAELEAQWRSAPVEDLLVQTEGRTVRELANEILAVAGWL
jgi:chloramphenicol 3-O-phosphotransferase